MDKYIDSIIRSCAMVFIVILSMRVVNVYEEKTRLEIEKLKYELSLYKEQGDTK